MLSFIDAQNVWIIKMKAREGSNSEGRKEFALVQHELQNAAQLILICDGKQPSITNAFRPHASQVVGQIGPVVDEPLEAPFEIGQAIQHLRFKGLDSEKRDQSHHRPNLHREMVAIGKSKNVIEESVFLVPKSDTIMAAMAHGVCDINEVFPEFARHVFVTGFSLCQLKSDRQQIERVHGHPTRSVGLLNVASGGKWAAPVKDADIVQPEEAALEDIHSVGGLAIYPPREVQH